VKILWATRGKTWGFRILRTASLANPLQMYEEAFAGSENSPEVFQARAGVVAVRFADPDGRKDRAGRVIPHDFVLLGSDACYWRSLDDAQIVLWAEVGNQYASVWDRPTAPTPDDVTRQDE
jgi:hypothetical protein